VPEQLAAELWTQTKDLNQDFIRVAAHSLASSVRDEAMAWVKALCSTMHELDAAAVQSVHEKMSTYRDGLHRVPSTLEELKFVLNIINTIRYAGTASSPLGMVHRWR
jgi:dynein heavy chain, axonemal